MNKQFEFENVELTQTAAKYSLSGILAIDLASMDTKYPITIEYNTDNDSVIIKSGAPLAVETMLVYIAKCFCFYQICDIVRKHGIESLGHIKFKSMIHTFIAIDHRDTRHTLNVKNKYVHIFGDLSPARLDIGIIDPEWFVIVLRLLQIMMVDTSEQLSDNNRINVCSDRNFLFPHLIFEKFIQFLELYIASEEYLDYEKSQCLNKNLTCDIASWAYQIINSFMTSKLFRTFDIDKLFSQYKKHDYNIIEFFQSILPHLKLNNNEL